MSAQGDEEDSDEDSEEDPEYHPPVRSHAREDASLAEESGEDEAESEIGSVSNLLEDSALEPMREDVEPEAIMQMNLAQQSVLAAQEQAGNEMLALHETQKEQQATEWVYKRQRQAEMGGGDEALELELQQQATHLLAQEQQQQQQLIAQQSAQRERFAVELGEAQAHFGDGSMEDGPEEA